MDLAIHILIGTLAILGLWISRGSKDRRKVQLRICSVGLIGALVAVYGPDWFTTIVGLVVMLACFVGNFWAVFFYRQRIP